MIAGRLKYKLEILEPRRSFGRFGEEVLEFVACRTVAAERLKLSGRRSEEIGEHFPDYTASFNIRSAHPVSENWRVRQIGGHTYTVVAVEPNLDRGFNTLICERVND